MLESRVQLSSSSITAVQKIITGDPLDHQDHPIAPYRSGGDIVAFFGSIPGLNVDSNLGTRWRYVEEVLRSHNGTPRMREIVEAAVSPVHFLKTSFNVKEAVEHLNAFLAYDGYRLRHSGRGFRLLADEGSDLVNVDSAALEGDGLSFGFIREQLEKAEDRVEIEDFDGAITTARSLVEGVLQELNVRLSAQPIDAKGDLLKLYKQAHKNLRLDPNSHDADSLQKILRGLTSIVDGLGSLRNRMGDAHARQYKPKRHHAVLAVNAARTLTTFLLETAQFQETTEGR